MKRLLTALAFFILMGYGTYQTALAGPPPGGAVQNIPFQIYCHPSAAAMVDALMKQFAVHVSLSFKANENLTVYLLTNPTTGFSAILGTNLQGTCLVFAGKDTQTYKRPAHLPDAPPTPEAQSTES